MISASEAREQSKANISENTQYELSMAEKSIKTAINEGNTECWCYEYLHKQTIMELSKLGYNTTDHSDQREGTMFKIRW